MMSAEDNIHSLVDALKYRAQHHPHKPAFIFRDPTQGQDGCDEDGEDGPSGSGGEESIRLRRPRRHVQTFQSVYRLGGRFAAALRAGGVRKGQLVVNTLPNSPERVVGEAGIILSGAGSVNAHCLLADGSDLLATLRDSRASAILVDPDVIHSPWHVLKKHVTTTTTTTTGAEEDEDELNDGKAVVVVVESSELPDLKKVFFVRRGGAPTSSSQKGEGGSTEDGSGSEDFLSRLEAKEDGEGETPCADWFVADDVSGDDICSVFTTSGSTGFSKLVAHTHGGLVEAVLRANPVTEELTGEEVEFSMAPLGWMGGYVGITILRGGTRVLADTHTGLSPDLVDFMLNAFQEEGVALTFIPAPRLPLLVDRVRQRRAAEGKVTDPDNPGTSLHILDRLTLGGHPITRSLVQMAGLLARKVFVLYGTTETFLISSFTVPDPNTFQDFDCGVVVRPGGELKIVAATASPENCKDESINSLPAGMTGMILFKRPVMMKGYLHDPEATASAFTRDGFFRTGDVGRLDDRGHVLVEGRGSDAIMRGPYIFYPGWLEERIRACPGVRDVMVVGVPNPAANEELCACVTLASEAGMTLAEVRDFVEDIVTSDDDPLSPRPRHYLSFDVFPVTSTGKPHRTFIKKQAAERLSVSSHD